MPTTPKGLVYPDSTEHTRLWDHLHNLATSIETALDNLVPPGAWQTYTPAWTAATTNPVLGNGTITGRYRLLGAKHVDVRINLTIGSTTTLGSGAYSLSLPFAAHATGLQQLVGDVFIASTLFLRGRIAPSTSKADLWVPNTTAGTYDRQATGTVPTNFTTGSTMMLGGTYEAA